MHAQLVVSTIYGNTLYMAINMTYSPFSTAEYCNSKVTVIQKDTWSMIFVIFPHTQVPCMAVRVAT